MLKSYRPYTLEERGTQMFGIGKKQEELEHELLSKQAEADRYLKKLSEVTDKMRLVQKETETGIASMEVSQSELNGQMEKLLEAVSGAAGEAKQQITRNRELQKQIVRRPGGKVRRHIPKVDRRHLPA